MSARKAFVLGAVVGAGLLAGIGAVSAGTSNRVAAVRLAVVSPASSTARRDDRADLLDSLKQLDIYLQKALEAERQNGEDGSVWIHNAEELKGRIIADYFGQAVDGAKLSDAMGNFDCVDRALEALDIFDKLNRNLRPPHPARSVFLAWLNKATSCKRNVIDTFFSQPVYGVTMSDAIKGLDCVDAKLIGFDLPRVYRKRRERKRRA